MKDDIMWLPIEGYYNFYEVSNIGEVRSLDRTVGYADGRIKRLKGRLLSPSKNGGGYLQVKLSGENKTEYKYVHRLVAECFLPIQEGKSVVNHIDGDPCHNHLGNLEWVNISENALHAYKIGLNKSQGGGHPNAVAVVDNISGRRFPTIRAFCAHYGINYSSGRNFLNGQQPLPKTIDLTEYSLKKLKDENVLDERQTRS